jgi:uncharacterized repeat protein (TIGR01451 family)
MRSIFNFQMAALLVAALTIADKQAEAQSFGLSVTPSANSVTVNNSLTYTIIVTNLTGSTLLDDTLVTNQFSTSVQFVSANVSQGSYTNIGNVVLFDLGAFALGGIAQVTLTVEPTTAGFITNTVTVASIEVPDTTSTNVVIQATNIVIEADLGVAMTGPAQMVVTNDLMTYAVSATNLGPSAAANVMLTNTLPTGVIFKSVSPNQPFTTAGSNLIFNLGTLASDGQASFQFTVQPTNAGVLPFSASIGAAGITDPNTANNFAGTNITVIDYLPGTLVAFTNSPQSTNFLNGLLEQSITVSNAGLSSVPAVRVVVTGLTNRLFNAVGTNNGNPFVVYGATLAAGQNVNLLLQYFPRKSFAFDNSQLQAFAVPVPDLSPPAVSSVSTNINITRIVELPNGNMVIEWPAIANRTYTVVYSDNVLFSNAIIAPPSIVAPANDVEWIDYGPPTTVSAPTNTNARFYRVLQNP